MTCHDVPNDPRHARVTVEPRRQRVSRRTRRLQRRLLGPEIQDLKVLRVRIQIWLTVLLVGTNVIGAAILVALNLLIIPGGGPSRELWLAMAVAVPVYVLIAVIFGATLITRKTITRLRWVTEGQTPTARQRRDALRLPWRITRVQFALWLGAAFLFPGIAVVVQPGAALPIASGVVIAGLVTGAFAYLLTEFVLRPVAAKALEDQGDGRLIVAGVRRKMVLFWLVGTGAPALGLIMAAIVALIHPEDVTLKQYAWAICALAVIVMWFGLFVTLLNASAVVRPIATVREALALVRSGELDVHVPVDDSTELGMLQAGFNDMVAGLRERERIRDLFGRHVGESVAAVATHSDVELGGETLEASVLMIDLIGSTGYASERPATEVVEMLNRFFTVIVEEVERRNGLVNKFMGDAVLAIFGAPVHLDNHATAALSAARGIMARLGDEVPEIGSGIGVSTGEVVAGNVGAASRFEYTVIGDAVNSAARLTELAKAAPGHVLVTRRSVEAAYPQEQELWIDHGDTTLRGRPTPTPLSVMRDPVC